MSHIPYFFRGDRNLIRMDPKDPGAVLVSKVTDLFADRPSMVAAVPSCYQQSYITSSG